MLILVVGFDVKRFRGQVIKCSTEGTLVSVYVQVDLVDSVPGEGAQGIRGTYVGVTQSRLVRLHAIDKSKYTHPWSLKVGL